MGIIRRLAKIALTAYLAMSGAMLAWTFLWPEPNFETLQPADAIVCLGGGMTAQGVLAPSVLTRVDRCVELYDAGLAPVIIFTGGTASPDGPSAGFQMGQYAQSIGLPGSAVIIEGRAQSTLQNALFSLDLMTDTQDFIVVTEAFHLPRSWASFRWAGWERGSSIDRSFTLVMSEPVRSDPATGEIRWSILGRESLAIWFNIGRAAAYSIAPDPSVDWLH